jgi:plastocyanin
MTAPRALSAALPPRFIRACWPLFVSACCGLASHAQGAQQTVRIVSDSTGAPLADAAVSIHVKGASSHAAPDTIADLGQRDKNFTPSLLVVQTGTLVNFPNFDTVRHHVYSFSPIKPFEIKLYAGTPTKPVLFDKAGTATLGCNIHDRMVAYIHVVDTPYFGVTDKTGTVTLALPPGEHRIRVWAPVLSESQPGIEQALRTGPPAVVRVNF